MFTSTMNDTEIQRESRKEFFELSTKVRIAAERFNRRHCDMINDSRLQQENAPASLISKSVEKHKWRTRRNNTWTSHFRFDNSIVGEYMETQCHLYTAVPRTGGTEYIFLDNLSSPITERFTMHFIERYKERHLKPRCIDTGTMPAPLYFKIKNPDCIMGRYYKTTDIDIEEGTHKRFWIAPEGIYVTDYIEGMLTYITFMDKDDLSPLKKQVYEEEIVWDLAHRITDKNLSDEERSRASFRLASTANFGQIFERFAKRNVADDENGKKQEMLLHIREVVAEQTAMIQEVKDSVQQQEKERLRKNRVTGTLNIQSLIDEVEIKDYDIQNFNRKLNSPD